MKALLLALLALAALNAHADDSQVHGAQVDKKACLENAQKLQKLSEVMQQVLLQNLATDLALTDLALNPDHANIPEQKQAEVAEDAAQKLGPLKEQQATQIIYYAQKITELAKAVEACAQQL
jgi:hypothetical protein